MTPSALSKHLFAQYAACKLDHLHPGICRHEVILGELHRLVESSNNLLTLKEVGTSLEGRSINLVTCGRGEKKVLLWSQMHGDEFTATLALMDLLNFLISRDSREEWVDRMLRETTLHLVPMLNPDGAERAQRHTAVGIDMNRDARVLATPEAKILHNLQRRLKPEFGFNLHDQELSTVGTTKAVTAIALLAPALDEKRTAPMVRVRAMRVAALIARSLGQFVHGHIASYNDSFEPRAFGDNMQAWGTSTVLIESGHWADDPEKAFIRKLNFVAILTALRSIGDGSYQDVALEHYQNLQENGKNIYDIIIRGIELEASGDWSHQVDVGLILDKMHNKDAKSKIVTIKNIGDLSTYAGLTNIDGCERKIPATSLPLEKVVPLAELLNMLQLYHPAT